MQEQRRHRDWFEYYYNLGADRTFTKVSSHFGVSLNTICKASRCFNWPAKVKERDDLVFNKIQEENLSDITESMNTYRKVIKASVAKYIASLKDGRVQITSVKDFVKLVELELKICGFQDQLSQVNNSIIAQINNDNSVKFVLNSKEKLNTLDSIDVDDN